jgi:hypothetical protein
MEEGLEQLTYAAIAIEFSCMSNEVMDRATWHRHALLAGEPAGSCDQLRPGLDERSSHTYLAA